MADSIEIRGLRGVAPEILTEAFNQAFADYVVPFQATAEYLRFRWRLARVDWDLSLGAFDGDRLVGFCWHGIDTVDGEVQAYNAGTGVLPAWRGHALVDRICEETWPLLLARGARRCTLEVIAGNDRAVRVYERIGFTSRRELVYMHGEFATAVLRKRAASVELRDLADPPWNDLQALQRVMPAWDFMLSGARAQKSEVRVVGAFDRGEMVGAVILRDSDHTLCWLSVSQERQREGIASALVMSANGAGDRWRMVNVDRRAVELLAFLHSLGMEENLYQYEMEREIPGVRG